MRKFLRYIVLVLLAFNFTYAIQENMILKTMQKKIDEVVKVLENNQIANIEKQKQIANIVDDVFDYELMGKISLGRQYNDLNDNQKKIFIQKFEQKLKNSHIDKFDLYTNQNIELKDIVKTKNNRVELPMEILSEKDTYKVIYKFYKNSSDEWFIYDIDILGVSIVQTYKTQFTGALQKWSFDEFINKLDSKEN